MAFPTVEATNHSVEATGTTEHTVNLPANIQAGETLLVFFATDGENTTTFPEGWTKILNKNYGTACHLSIAWRKADGEEGSSITVTTTSSEPSAHISYRISGAADPSSTPPEVSTGATSVTANPDPDSLSPTGGSKEYLWIAVAMNDDGRDLYTGYPSSYSYGQNYQSDEDTFGCVIAVARRNLEASSEDPGTFTIEESEQWIACTISVYPVPPVVAPTVTTQAVSNIGKTTATGNGTITDTGGENCSKRGVCWNTTGNPTVADSKSEETDSFGTGAFSRPMTGLSSGQKYYVKAYAYNSGGYGYGGQVEFTTIFEQAAGGGSVGMAGTLGRNIFVSVGGGAVGMEGTLNAIKRFLQNVGGGSVGMTGMLSWKFVQAVGGGSVAMAGTLGRFIKVTVGDGAVAMAGAVNTLTKITVGGGAVGMAGSLGLKIKIAVGKGTVAIAGALVGLFIYHYPVVKIDGIQVLIKKGSLVIDKKIEERSVAEFTVVDKDASSHYRKGQPVEIYDNGNHLTFTGVIDTPSEQRVGRSGIYHYVRCADNHYLADKRIVAESYEDTLAGDIVEDIRTKYLDAEGVTIGEIQNGPTLKQVVLNYVRTSEAFDALAEKANFIWYIDELKKLYFISRATNVAWWTATSSLIHNAKLSHGNPSYRNRQYVRGGKAETDSQVEDRTGDGETKSFAMGYPLAKVPTIKEDTVEKTVGIKGIDTGKDWYWSKGDNVVTADTAPANGVAIEVTYVGEFSIITLSEDEDAIADRQTVEGGGTGYVDDIARDPNLTTMDAAFETAAKKLQRYAVMGRTLTYQTYERGLEPGQLQTVNYPLLNLNNAEMLIESVKITGVGKELVYNVTALEGPELGSWSKLFQQLAEREKTIDRLTVGEEGTVTILVQKSEEWGWNESVVVILHLTETLRPNAAGDETSLDGQYPDSGEHWDKVDEESADDNDTYVIRTAGAVYKRDLYNLPASSGSGTINFIKVYFRCKGVTSGYAYAKPSLRSDSMVTDGTAVSVSLTDYVTYSQQWNTNPADGQPWEWADIDALQIGVAMQVGPLGTMRCTQVYIEVDYTP